jgi:hypothetical protein
MRKPFDPRLDQMMEVTDADQMQLEARRAWSASCRKCCSRSWRRAQESSSRSRPSAPSLRWRRLGRSGQEKDATKKQTAEEAYAAALKAMERITDPTEDRRGFADQTLAKNILEAELGEYSDWQPEYFIDETTRDRLIAHTRQDAAHALLSTLRLIFEVRELHRHLQITRYILTGLCGVLLLLMLFGLYVVYR